MRKKSVTINKLWAFSFTFVFGAILFAHPTSALDLVIRVAASILLIIATFTELDVLRSGADIKPINHLPGVMFCVLALVLFVFKESIISIVPLIFGIFVLVSCISKLQDANHIKKCGGKATIPLVLAIIGIIFSLLIITNPFKSVILLVRITGLAFMYSGLSDIIIYIRIKQKY